MPLTKIKFIFRMVFEFLPVGGVQPSSSFFTVKLMPYVTLFDHFIMACQVNEIFWEKAQTCYRLDLVTINIKCP
jgi:hypothetical protein